MLFAQDYDLNMIRLTYKEYRLVEGNGATLNRLFEVLEEWDTILNSYSQLDDVIIGT